MASRPKRISLSLGGKAVHQRQLGYEPEQYNDEELDLQEGEQELPPDSGKDDEKAADGSADGQASDAKPQSEKLVLDENDYSGLTLKEDHANRPLWICPDGRIILESFSPAYKPAYDFLIAVAEPSSRPESIHEYKLTPHSLYAAVSVGLHTETIFTVLDRLSKFPLPEEISAFVRSSTQNYGKVKLVLQENQFRVESPYPEILQRLLQDETIRNASLHTSDSFSVSAAPTEKAAATLAAKASEAPEQVNKGDEPEEDEGMDVDDRLGEEKEQSSESQLHYFPVDARQVEVVKKRCLPDGLNYPMLEEYDFMKDTQSPDLPFELKPGTKVRPYQQKCLSKMFGNGRARSGIIVLPCGAGKTLAGIAAAARVRKSVLILCLNSVAVDQWKSQFKLWSTLGDEEIKRFTAQTKETFDRSSGVCVTTYNMVSFEGKRSEASKKYLERICSIDWGLLILDEVHVVPAAMFRKVIGITKAHCKLGLTATLVREDERVTDLNFLIGPKLYEANWLDLQKQGFIANVQCAEVWCPMTKEFFREYLKKENQNRQQVLYVMNPNKFQVCQFLMNYHEQARGDKVIIFSDNIFALREYGRNLRRPFIYGGTSHSERTMILEKFKHSNDLNTIFLSKVGDNSIDIPEANVIIQISSHGGSRRQEAQRLGRILRPKQKSSIAGPQQEEEFNAFFYSLVSQDTMEMYYSTKRQQFLIDQGYSFKVITDILKGQDESQLCYSTKKDQVDLLAKVLSAGEKEVGEEKVQEAADNINKELKESAKAQKRKASSIDTLTGAEGVSYMEYAKDKDESAKKAESVRKQLAKKLKDVT